MAYLNESYVATRYGGPRYFNYGAAGGPTPGVYSNERYLHRRYVSERYVSRDLLVGGPFIEAGFSATVDVTGFQAGFQFSKQGTKATTGVSSYYTGFSPDPGGILDNDSDPDGDPLSFTVITQPEVGTLTVYAGGAFDWIITPGTPVGRYSWTYELFAGGESGGIGTVTMEHGNVFAESSVSGFAGQFGFGFNSQGTKATSFTTGFISSLLLTFDKAGTAATLDSQGNAGDAWYGLAQRGTRAEVGVQGYAGDLVGQFNQQGTGASVTVTGYAGTLDTGTFFNSQGTTGTVTVQGFAGELLESLFIGQGSQANVSISGFSNNLVLGVNAAGTTATLDVQGFVPQDPSEVVDWEIIRFNSVSQDIRFNSRSQTIIIGPYQPPESLGTTPPITGSFILLESGDFLLLESGDLVIRE